MHCYIDTSAFYAYMVEGDRYHVPVKEYLTGAVASGRALFSSSYVLCEVLELLQTRHGAEAAARFMSDVYPLVLWRWVDRKMHEEMWQLVESQKKRGFTVVDASAVACIRERAGSVCVAVGEGLEGFGFDVFPKL